MGNDRRGTCVEYRSDPCRAGTHMSSNVKETARWRRRRRRRRIVPRGFFKLANVVLERRTRDGVVNFRVQFRRGELRGRTSTLGVAYNHRKQPLSNVRCALVTNIFHTNWIFDRYESYESSSDRFERIANKLEQTSRKKNKRREVIDLSGMEHDIIC